LKALPYSFHAKHDNDSLSRSFWLFYEFVETIRHPAALITLPHHDEMFPFSSFHFILRRSENDKKHDGGKEYKNDGHGTRRREYPVLLASFSFIDRSDKGPQIRIS
jgi:hypothetical protein